MQKLLLVCYQKIAPQAKSGKYFQIWFFPDLGGKNGGILSMRMQVILDSSFARPGSAPIWGGKKGEFRDWTTKNSARVKLNLRSCTSLLRILM